jgi:hypothetical protein
MDADQRVSPMVTGTSNVRLGSFSEVGARNREVCFAPVNGHINLPGRPQPSGFTGDKEGS